VLSWRKVQPSQTTTGLDTALSFLWTVAYEARSYGSVGLFMWVAGRIGNRVTKRRDIL
jgi:hypothetical protein